jgi:hypothetical protein
MSAQDDLIGGLEKLLDKFPANTDLAGWQNAFRRVVFATGMRVLKNHPELIIGPAPARQAAVAARPAPMPPEAISAPMPMHIMQGGGALPSIMGGPVYIFPAGGPTKPIHPSAFIEYICMVTGCPPPTT